MDELLPMPDAGPVPALLGPSKASAAVPDTRPWRLRRPVFAGVLLYGTLALFLGTVGWFWLRERERGRQDALLTRVHGASSFFALDPDGAIRILEDEVLSARPSDDTRRRALLVVAAAHDQAKRYDEAERAYETARREWPAGLELGPLYVPFANMLVRAGKVVRARELLAAPGATAGYGTDAEVEVVRARINAALAAPLVPPIAPTK